MERCEKLAAVEHTHTHTHTRMRTADYINNLSVTRWGEKGPRVRICVHAYVCRGVKAKLARLYKQLLGHTMYLSTLIGM